MSTKMKGLLKGLRYISQIFEEEEDEKEIQIGFPTDVKHVAHIGWDGPSVNSPSWMNEFKSPTPENASQGAPQHNEEPENKDNNVVEEVNEAAPQESSTKKNAVKSSPGRERDTPGLPKSSRRQPSMDSIGSTDSPVASPTSKSKSSRRRQKQKEATSPRGGESSSSQSLPNIPKKSRQKKSKDNKDGDGSLKSSLRSKEKGSRHGSRQGGSDDGSITKQYNGEANSSTSISSLKEG